MIDPTVVIPNDHATSIRASRLRRAAWMGVLLLFLLTVYVILVPNPIDDTYVYFNYARNFAAGRPFAYDARAIPSEGFTSLIYLLLLVPFEAFHINLLFVGIILNILALCIVLVLAAGLASRIFRQDVTLLVFAVFSSLILLDEHILSIIAHGNETLLNPVVLFAACWMIVRACDATETRRKIWMQLFFAATFVAFLIRPENVLLIGGSGGVVLLLFYPNRREVIGHAALFAVVFVLYHGLKYAVFHDLFPTGFYRKVGANKDSGSYYVLTAILNYGLWLLLAGALAVVVRRKSGGWRRHPGLVFLGLVAGTTLVFFSQTFPLAGYDYRFLINDTLTLFFVISLLLVYAVGHGWRPLLWGAALVVLGAVLASHAGTLSDVDLYNRTLAAVNQHLYVQFGTFLYSHLPDREQITLVFGDAGVFPYTFQSRFIDTNGLAEPYLARLFRVPDGEDKAEKYADYILSWKPDLIVLGNGEVDANGNWTPALNNNSPFQEGPQPLSVFARYRDYGMQYVCTVKSYYDLHMGVWKDSPAHNEIVATLLDYCQQHGYRLAKGFTVALNGEQITFPAVP